MRVMVRQCRACPRWIAPASTHRRHPWLRERYARHTARGLCVACYVRVRTAGCLDDYPRATWTRDELLDEWEFLRSTGVGVVEAAPRLGMTVDALAQALERARKDGDPRARFAWDGIWAAKRERAA
jgi:hypothetical protein